MDTVHEVEDAWEAVFTQVLEDGDGTELGRLRALWATAVQLAYPGGGDVQCAGDAFGPILTPGGLVVHSPVVAVGAPDLDRAMEACEAAWRRFHRVDEDGFEHPDDVEGEAPDTFGLPVVVAGKVLVAFDNRGDLEPYPHRARTCLAVLVDELRSHGCVPCTITGLVPAGRAQSRRPARLPPRAESADDDAATADPADEATTTERPEWLPDFHRIESAGRGTPSGAVPFVLVSRNWAWAWDPDRGLLKVPGHEMEAPGRVLMLWDCLTADGTRLRFIRDRGPTADSLPPGSVEYDLRAGCSRNVQAALSVAEAPGGWPRLIRRPDGAGGWSLVIASGPDTPGRSLGLDGDLYGDVTCPAAQFSPTGRWLLTSHARAAGGGTYAALTDIDSGAVRIVEEVQSCGSASWSPDETRCLMSRRGNAEVRELASGATSAVPLHRFPGDDVPGRAEARALGWLGDEGVLVRQSYGRRIRLSYQPLRGRVRYAILDLPAPDAPASAVAVYPAAHVVHRAPELVGMRR